MGGPGLICYSSCVVSGISEIDIAIINNYQEKGLVKAVAKAFIETSIDKSIEPNWDYFEENIPSLKTDQSLGFVKLQEHQF